VGLVAHETKKAAQKSAKKLAKRAWRRSGAVLNKQTEFGWSLEQQ
jgi:hypothetical protein